MSTDRDVTTRIVRSWLHEDAHEDAGRILNLVLDEIDTTPQRRAGWLARRFTLMNNFARVGLAAVVLVAVVGIGFALSGTNLGGPGATPTPTATATTSAAATPSAFPPISDVPLDAGTYSLGTSFPVRLTFEVPAGWVSCSAGPVDQAVCKPSTDTEPGSGVGFLIVDNVVADPCGPSNELVDPPVGPSVDDLVAAISSLEGFEATAPMDINVDGFDGKQFTLTSPADATCELKTWATESRTNGVGPDEVNLLRILNVDGVRVVISGGYQTGTSEEQLAAIQQVIASVHIEP
jgi:hypothetical protein